MVVRDHVARGINDEARTERLHIRGALGIRRPLLEESAEELVQTRTRRGLERQFRPIKMRTRSATHHRHFAARGDVHHGRPHLLDQVGKAARLERGICPSRFSLGRLRRYRRKRRVDDLRGHQCAGHRRCDQRKRVLYFLSPTVGWIRPYSWCTHETSLVS